MDHGAKQYKLKKAAKTRAMQKEPENPVLASAGTQAWLVEPSCLSPTVTPGGSFQKGSQYLAKHGNPLPRKRKKKKKKEAKKWKKHTARKEILSDP